MSNQSVRFVTELSLFAGNPAGKNTRRVGELHAETRGEHHRYTRSRSGPLGERTQGWIKGNLFLFLNRME